MGERYELLKILGYGSYSAVVLALDKTTGEKVRAAGFGTAGVLGSSGAACGQLVVLPCVGVLRLSAQLPADAVLLLGAIPP